MAIQHENTLARRNALQALYQSEILNVPADKVLDQGLVPVVDQEDLASNAEDQIVEKLSARDKDMIDRYVSKLVLGVAGHKAEIDRLISGCSQNWAIDRMPVVDRCILRLAVFEMRYVDAVPVSVTINEAVELAKEFGGEDDSHRFVNGILGRLAREAESAGDAGRAAAAATVAALNAAALAEAEAEEAADEAVEAE